MAAEKKDLIEINSGLFVNTDETQSSEYSYASMAKIAALSAGGNLDIMIADPETLKHYESQGAFLNLSDFLPEDLKNVPKKKAFSSILTIKTDSLKLRPFHWIQLILLI